MGGGGEGGILGKIFLAVGKVVKVLEILEKFHGEYRNNYYH